MKETPPITANIMEKKEDFNLTCSGSGSANTYRRAEETMVVLLWGEERQFTGCRSCTEGLHDHWIEVQKIHEKLNSCVHLDFPHYS